MRAAEQGFLLLTSHLGDPERKVLTVPQLRDLSVRMGAARREDPWREMTEADLAAVGYDHAMAQRILQLLDDEEQLRWYLQRGSRKDCVPITRISEPYPSVLRKRLGLEAPGCLWAKGDLSLLNRPAIALVGSRALREENRSFALEAGYQAARQDYVLISGNARGADKTAQDTCLAAGGQIISVVADKLEDKPLMENILWISEDGYDLPFSNLRALSRNRVIHCLGTLTLVAQSDLGKGGTWDGTAKNLRRGWSAVYCFADGSEGMAELMHRGAVGIQKEELADFTRFQPNTVNFIDQ